MPEPTSTESEPQTRSGLAPAAPNRPLHLVIAGGGTGGHVLPAVAVLEEFGARHEPVEAFWIGSETGLEREAAAKAGIPFAAIPTGKLRRYLSLRTLVDAVRVPLGVLHARRHLRAHRPDVVLSTGGFVSVPTVVAARGVAPVVTHEQTAIVGLANQVNARFAAALAVSFDGTLAAASRIHRRPVVTGNPIRASLRRGSADRARERWGLSPALPLVYVTGGARGASPINTRLAALLPDLLERCQVVHQTGPASANPDAARLTAEATGWSEALRRRYVVVEYVGDELADLYAAAALIVGRSGAGTVAELAALGKPAVLIPLPGAGGDEQTRNARTLADVGAAVLLPQSDATPERLRAVLVDLLEQPDRLRGMAEAALRVGRPDAAARLADVLLDVAGRPAPPHGGASATSSNRTMPAVSEEPDRSEVG